MKRVFPVIIILISLSLLGIIFIQVSWIRTLALFREEQLKEKLSLIVDEVGQELEEQRSAPFRNPNQMPGMRWPSDGFDIYRQFSIASRFTLFEVQEKLRKAFERKGLKQSSFEFAIASSNVFEHYELKSNHFMDMAADTVHNLRVLYPLIPAGGSLLESLAPEEVLIVVVPDVKSYVFQSIGWMIAGAILFTLIIITAFFLTVSTLLRQKKMSEIKSDFINNMTHEFKTPLATISLAVDALKNEKLKEDHEKRAYFTNIIKDENKRMNKQVETILQAAQMDRQEVQLNTKVLHVHGVIQKALDNLSLQIQEKNGTVSLQLSANNDLMEADEMHLTNLVSNLLDNAVKYAGNELFIRITTRNPSRHSIRIAVEDKGIGMTKETVGRIFEKFYRAHTGNLHNVKGFGLGLSYVKTMVEAHRGKIKVESVPGKGSTFTIDFPLTKAS